jgi:hypothetical protein
VPNKTANIVGAVLYFVVAIALTVRECWLALLDRTIFFWLLLCAVFSTGASSSSSRGVGTRGGGEGVS